MKRGEEKEEEVRGISSTYIQTYLQIKKIKLFGEAGMVVKNLGTFVALPEETGSIPSSYMVAYN